MHNDNVLLHEHQARNYNSWLKWVARQLSLDVEVKEIGEEGGIGEVQPPLLPPSGLQGIVNAKEESKGLSLENHRVHPASLPYFCSSLEYTVLPVALLHKP